MNDLLTSIHDILLHFFLHKLPIYELWIAIKKTSQKTITMSLNELEILKSTTNNN